MRMYVAVGLGVAAVALSACSSSGSFVQSTPITHDDPTTSVGTATVSLGLVTKASIVVPVGATTTEVAMGPADGPLVAVRTPPTAGNQPVLRATPATTGSTTRRIVVGLAAGSGGPAVKSTTDLTILLNPKVAWTISLTGGASRESVDGLGGHIVEVTLGKTSKATVAVPASAGVTTIHEVGGVSELAITAEPGESTSVTASAGAGSITIDGVAHTGIAAGTTISQPGYANAPNQLDVRLSAGASMVTISPH